MTTRDQIDTQKKVKGVLTDFKLSTEVNENLCIPKEGNCKDLFGTIEEADILSPKDLNNRKRFLESIQNKTKQLQLEVIHF